MMITEEKIREAYGLTDWDILIYEELDSTNNLAKRLAAEGNLTRNTAIIANSQTAGRGRRGRSFYSPAGRSIYLTLVFVPREGMLSGASYTTFTAVAVARAIEAHCQCDAEIKWVNDIFVDGRKVCGILCESSNVDNHIIIGIGINTGHQEFPAPINEVAGTLEDLTGTAPDRSALIGSIIREMDRIDRNFGTAHMEEYRARSLVLNKYITAMVADRMTCSGLVVAMEDDGSLLIEEDGRIHKVSAGEISIKTIKPG